MNYYKYIPILKLDILIPHIESYQLVTLMGSPASFKTKRVPAKWVELVTLEYKINICVSYLSNIHI